MIGIYVHNKGSQYTPGDIRGMLEKSIFPLIIINFVNYIVDSFMNEFIGYQTTVN